MSMSKNCKKKIWLGLHDHANFSGKWLDNIQPYSWLRVFEKAAGDEIETHAILAEKYETYEMSSSIRGVKYYFYNNDKRLIKMLDRITSINPDVLFLNICWYGEIVPSLKVLRKRLPSTRFLIRVHHDVHYLEKQAGFLEAIFLSDGAIVSTKKQKKRMIELGYLKEVFILPFGVDKNEFSEKKAFNDRDIDIVSFANSHPARNKKLIEKIYSRLNKKGFKAQNVIGLSREDLSRKLSSAKYMLLSSLTEASGSRILLEAISAGCTPIVFKECGTAVEVLNDHECGKIIESGLILKLPEKKVRKPISAEKKIEKQVVDILRDQPKPCKKGIKSIYEFDNEVEELYEILKENNN